MAAGLNHDLWIELLLKVSASAHTTQPAATPRVLWEPSRLQLSYRETIWPFVVLLGNGVCI
jgi:hypothetical protein